MGEFIKNIVIIVIGLIVGFIASAYVFYFIGMTMSLAASMALGIEGELLANIFAWIGVGIAATIFAVIGAISIQEASSNNAIHITEEEFDELFRKGDK